MREQDQFRLISQRTGGLGERYGPRARLLNLSDRMEVAMGRIPSDPVPWGDADDLEKRLAAPPLPSELWLASSGPSQAMERKVMRGCCVADLKPWAVPSELSGGFARAGQQQGATGLWVHQQFEQGRGRVVS